MKQDVDREEYREGCEGRTREKRTMQDVDRESTGKDVRKGYSRRER